MKRAIGWCCIIAALVAGVCVVFCRRPGDTSVIRVAGSTTMEPFMRKAASVFSEGRPFEVTIDANGSKKGIEALVNGFCDVAMSSTEITTDALLEAEKRRIRVKSFVVGYDVIVPIVDVGNPLSTIPMEKLKDVFAGRACNWTDLGGDDLPIAVMGRDASSGTGDVWDRLIAPRKTGTNEIVLEASSSTMLADVAGRKEAIGYVSAAFLNPEVKALQIDDKPPPIHGEPVLDYPLKRPLYLYVNEERFEGHLRTFVIFLLMTQEGQRALIDSGFYPAEPHGV